MPFETRNNELEFNQVFRLSEPAAAVAKWLARASYDRGFILSEIVRSNRGSARLFFNEVSATFLESKYQEHNFRTRGFQKYMGYGNYDNYFSNNWSSIFDPFELNVL